MKYFLTLLLVFSAIFPIYSQVTDKEVRLDRGDYWDIADLPTNITEYHDLLSTVVDMYNELSNQHQKLLIDTEKQLADTQKGLEKIESDTNTASKALNDTTNAIKDITTPPFYKEPPKFGINGGYGFGFINSTNIIEVNFMMTFFRYFYLEIGPFVNLTDTTNLGMKAKFGLWLK
jgi:hypothetical protein